MLIHISVPKEFKTDILAGRYRPRALRHTDYDISFILRRVLRSLFLSQLASVKSQLLCLTNVWSVDNRMDIGYSNAPNEATKLTNASLVLTFSIRPRPTKELPFPGQLVGRSKYWTLWGRENPNEYITVSIPRSEIFGLDGRGLDMLNVVYNAVGIVSRNHMQTFNNSLLEPTPVSSDLSMLCNLYRSKKGAALIARTPYSMWHYSLTAWTDYSQCLLPEFFDDEFPLYYVMYLDESIYGPDLNVTMKKYIDTKVQSFVARGLAKFAQSLSLRRADESPELYAALYLLLADKDKSEMESNTVTRINFVRRYYQNLDKAMEVPEFAQAIARFAHGNYDAYAKALLQGLYNNQLKNLIVYANMVEV